ncbi:hypothetical protein EJ06DRAFT_87904 [Trichodelitschia bisporula]|uniref:ER transporter 6TM N-terminal domain-containing protein n=1 Tax=Trichodelitschia bisporula TaxID=703511 RepID=A0A6G1HS50_9PEZI|nr:hypothetical protein EJ06DRAFT_87904 [Trichodelitschia bisporula]
MASDPLHQVPSLAADVPLGIGQNITLTRSRTKPSVKKRLDNVITKKATAIWNGLGLSVPLLLLMAKGGVPPTIALAMYQSTTVAQFYGNFGYLVAIISVIAMCVQPRAKFVQNTLLSAFTACLAAAVGLLSVYCVTQARKHSGEPPPPRTATGFTTYNSSASAVSGIWMFMQVYVINSLRARSPQLVVPAIIYSIFVIVISIYSSLLQDMTAGIRFILKILYCFLTGFAIATGVHFVVFPTSSRKIVMMEFSGFLKSLQECVETQRSYLQSLEKPSDFTKNITVDDRGSSLHPEAKAVKAAVGAMMGLHSKLQGDLPFAKREIAWGRLGPDDLKEMNKLTRQIMIPVLGLGAVTDIFQRIAAANDWTEHNVEEGLDPVEEEKRRRLTTEWSDNMKLLHNSFTAITEAVQEGLEHIMLQFSMLPRPRKSDVEAEGDVTRPGDTGFAAYMDQIIKQFKEDQNVALDEWCQRRGLKVEEEVYENEPRFGIDNFDITWFTHGPERHQRQLYVLLYLEYLMFKTGLAVLDMVHFADGLMDSGKLSRSHLILPGAKRLRKWIISTFYSRDDGDSYDERFRESDKVVAMGQAYSARRDPEHLPPQNIVERIGEFLRALAAGLRSSESAFGFRVALATLSIGIISYLHDTQTFFLENRLLWSMIMVAISMAPTAGQSLFSYVLRVIGTVIAMLASFLIYYIPDGQTAGILVFLWFFVSLAIYVLLKMPQLVSVGMVSIVTSVLIIGYELEVRKIGVAAITANGQKYFSITLIGVFRLATVAGGLFVAFIWTMLPYPITEHSQLRKDVGATLYLLASYYSIIHETIQSRIQQDTAELILEDPENNSLRPLDAARLKVYSKVMILISRLKMYSQMTKWELMLGGKFPKARYDAIITAAENIASYTTLMGYSSSTFLASAEFRKSQWCRDFQGVMSSVRPTSHEITSLLSILSSSIISAQPLPPYLRAPAPYGLTSKMEALDRDILSVRHIHEPGYAAFAVTQISTQSIISDLEVLLTNVKELVGELDFSFHITGGILEPSRDDTVSTIMQSTSQDSAKNKHE